MRFFRALAASFSYFSIFPTKSFDVAADGDAIALLPVVGLVIGALAGACAYGTYLATHSTLLASIVAWIASIALSGAIHIDGFLDCCDGLFAMVAPQRRLEIMRDPHHGTYAVVGMALVCVLWLYALDQIPPALMPTVLAGVGYLGRFGAYLCATGFKNQRTQAPLSYSRGLTLCLVVPFVVVLVQAVRIYDNNLGGLIALAVVVLLTPTVATLVGWFASRRLGGVVNGDCYGAVVVVTEVALLLVMPYLGLLP